MQILEKKLLKTKIAYIRFVGKYGDSMPTWGNLVQWIKATNTPLTESFGICHDNPNITENCRYDACIRVFEDAEESGDVKLKYIPECNVISVIHRGPYHKLSDTYSEIYTDENIRKYNIDLNAPTIEKYLNDPTYIAEEELLTEIMVIRKA